MVADDRRGLSGPVALYDLDAEEFPFSSEIGIEGRAAGDDEVELTTELLVDAAEEDATKAEGGPLGYLEELVP